MNRKGASPSGETGMSLIIVLMILVVVSLIGINAAQISTLAERTTRNDRYTQIAWESAESGLVDAEFDMRNTRQNIFGISGQTPTDITKFQTGCGTSGDSEGLCQLPALVTDKPAWLTVDLSAATNTITFGGQTGRSFPSGSGAQPYKNPNYLIEAIPDNGDGNRDRSEKMRGYVFRVTSMGFGPGSALRPANQAVVQMIFRN
ncbi:type IV pilus assembly protein PilX [Xylophilus ampelinus]|uniref:Type IV pilus assembly protein PilX n=2 Tax=Xylophilus ampelinus TaxID=54067 RepID=A0A318SZQ5_9BURK|nr:type IV pilus assembly protein PilX [Xylophilus ampelinus]